MAAENSILITFEGYPARTGLLAGLPSNGFCVYDTNQNYSKYECVNTNTHARAYCIPTIGTAFNCVTPNGKYLINGDVDTIKNWLGEQTGIDPSEINFY